MSAAVQSCMSCGILLFPARLFCPRCGQEDFSPVTVEHGEVAETTRLADGTLLATLTIPGGPSVVGRVTGGPATSGDRLPLSNDLNTMTGVYAYIPVRSTVSDETPNEEQP